MNKSSHQARVEEVLFNHGIYTDDVAPVLLQLGLFVSPLSLDDIKQALACCHASYDDVSSLAEELFEAHTAAVPPVVGEKATGTPNPPVGQAKRSVPLRPLPCDDEPCYVENLKDQMAIHKIAMEARAFADKVKGKHIIGFLGVTGVGKTTFMRYLLGHSLALQKHTTKSGHEITVIDSDVQSENLVIGHEKQSQTQEPFIERAPAAMGDDVYLVDLPGDFDTSLRMSVLLRHALTKAFILRGAASVRLVMMLSCEVLSVKRGSGVDDDLADVLDLFPNDQAQSCMLTLISPVARDTLGSNLSNLMGRSTLEHIKSIRCEVDGLTRDREGTPATSFITKLCADLQETELALQEQRLPPSPICYVANPLRGDDLDTARRFVMSRPACTDHCFNIAISSRVSTALTESCRSLLTKAASALGSLKSHPCDDEGAIAAAVLLDLLSVLINDLELNLRALSGFKEELVSKLRDTWVDCWLALCRSLNQAGNYLNPTDAEACVGVILRVVNFVDVANGGSRRCLPLDETVAAKVNEAMVLFKERVQRMDLRVLPPATIKQALDDVSQIEISLGRLPGAPATESITKLLAERVWSRMEEVKTLLKLDKDNCRPRELAANIHTLRSLSSACGDVFLRMTPMPPNWLDDVVGAVVENIQSLSTECSLYLHTVADRCERTIPPSSVISNLYSVTSCPELQEALGDTSLVDTFYRPAVAVVSFDDEDECSIDDIPHKIALLNALVASPDRALGDKALTMKNKLIAKARALINTRDVDAAFNERLHSYNGHAGRNEAPKSGHGQFEALEIPVTSGGIYKTIEDAVAVKTITGRRAVLKHAVQRLVTTAAMLTQRIETYVNAGLPLNRAFPATCLFLGELVGTLPEDTSDTDICDARAQLGGYHARAAVALKNVVGVLSDLSASIFIGNQRQPDWFVNCVNTCDAVMLILRAHPEAELQTIRECIDQNQKWCLQNLRDDVSSTAEAREYERLGKIVAEELIPMQQLGDRCGALVRIAQTEMEECEVHMGELCRHASHLDVADANFSEHQSRLRKMRAYFSSKAINSEIRNQLNETLAGMQRKLEASQDDFSKLVRVPPIIGSDFVNNMLDALHRLDHMDPSIRAAKRTHANASLQSAIVKLDLLLTDKRVDVGAVGLDRVFGSQYGTHLDAATLASWNRYEDNLRTQSEGALQALTHAWDDGLDLERIEACKHEYQRLCGRDKLVAATGERLSRILASYTERRVDSESMALVRLGEQVVAMSISHTDPFRAKWKAHFLNYFTETSKYIKRELRNPNTRFDDLVSVVEEAKAVTEFVRTHESLFQLLGTQVDAFDHELGSMNVEEREEQLILHATGCENVVDRVQKLLVILQQSSPQGAMRCLEVIRALIKVVLQNPSATDNAEAVVIVCRARKLAEMLDNEMTQDIYEIVRDFEERYRDVSSALSSEIVAKAESLLLQCLVGPNVVDALRSVARVAPLMAPDATELFAGTLRWYWAAIESTLTANLDAIRKGDLQPANFGRLADIINGFRSLVSPNDMREFLPGGMARHVKGTSAPAIEAAVRAAVEELLSKHPMDTWRDMSPADLVRYFATSRQLIQESQPLHIDSLPKPPVLEEALQRVLETLCDECSVAWTVVFSGCSKEAFESFQPLGDRIITICEKLREHSVGFDCDAYVARALRPLEDELSDLDACVQCGPKELASRLINVRRWAMWAPCLEPTVTSRIYQLLGKQGKRFVLDVGLLLEDDSIGKVITRSLSTLFTSPSQDWAKATTKISVKECIDRIQCEPDFSFVGQQGLMMLLAKHESEMSELPTSMRKSILQHGFDRTRKTFLKEVYSSKNEPGKLIANLCKMYALFSIRDAITADAIPDATIPHIIQVLTIYRLLNLSDTVKTIKLWFGFGDQTIPNHLVQILTGEGKSITLAILAAVLVIQGTYVDIVCYSTDLTHRDKAATEPFFVEMLNFKPEYVRYLTFSEVCELRCKGVGAVATSVLVGGSICPLRRQNGAPRVLLIDEVDVFFSKKFYGASYNAGVVLQGEEEYALVNAVYEGGGRFDVLASPQLAAVKEKYKTIHSQLDLTGLNKLFDHIALMLVESHSCYTRNDRYRLDPDTHQIMYKDDVGFKAVVYPNETSLLYMDLVKRGSLTKGQAKRYVGLDIHFGHYSYAEIPSRAENYLRILGVTGTLKAVGANGAASKAVSNEDLKILRNEFGVKTFTYAPSVFGPSKLNNESGFDCARDTVIQYTESDWLVSIVEAAKEAIRNGGACIIFAKNSFQYLPLIKARFDSTHVLELTEETPLSLRPGIIASAGSPETITVTTRAFGRGTDFHPTGNTAVTVIQTFYSSTESEHIQIRGRTARQGKHGWYKQVLCSKHMEAKFFPKEVRDASVAPEGQEGAFDFAAAASAKVADVLQKAVSENRLPAELAARRAEKMRTKTSGRTERRNAAKVFDVASWRVIDTLLSNTADQQAKLDCLVKEATSVMCSPHLITVLIDVSSSMQGGPWAALLVAFETFMDTLRQLPETSRVATTLCVIFFATNATVHYIGPVDGLTALPRVRPDGSSTNFEAAFEAAHKEFGRFKNHIKKVVFFTDGIPNRGSDHLSTVRTINTDFPSQLSEFVCIYFSRSNEVPLAVAELHTLFDTLKVPSTLFHPKNAGELKMAMATAAQRGIMHRH